MHTIDPDNLFGTGDFWSRFRRSVEVVVGLGESSPEKLLGVRDGFERYLREALRRADPPNVRATMVEPFGDPLPMSDEETLDLARERARRIEELTQGHVFSVAVETGVVPVRATGTTRQVVRTWAVVVAPVGLALGADGRGDEAWGSSGGQEVPLRLVEGLDSARYRTVTMPGTRRGGGMVASLTGGLESRRNASSRATFHALTSLLYGRLGGPRGPQTLD